LIAIVTQCFGPDLGGIEILMTGLADHLSKNGERIEVFADHIRSSGLAELARPYPIHRFGSIRPLRRGMKLAAIARIMTENDVSGLFADSWKSVAAIPLGAAPIAVLAHGTEFPPDASPARARRINAALKRSRAIIASSRYTASLVAPFMQGVEAKIVVINPPIAELPAAEPAAIAEIDAAIAGRAPVLTTLARLEPRKGVDSVLRALPALRARHPGVVYLIAGAGDDLARLQTLARQLGVEDCVVFLGEVVDIGKKAALLMRSDVYAMPSRRVGASVEGFGISYVEAAWYGAPSLAGGDGGSADAVLHDRTGLICEAADDDAVRQALSRLLDDPDFRLRLGAAAAAETRDARTWAAALPRYLATLGG
jgi:phosphatidylinositol alpha-1,6-mannosyltransferase